MNPPPLPLPTPPPRLETTPGPAVAPPALAVLGMIWLRFAGLLRFRTVLRFAGLVGATCVLTALSVSPGNAGQFNHWVTRVLTLNILPIVCLIMGGGALRNEIRNATMEYLWTRPVRKVHLVLGAYVAAVLLVWIQISVLTFATHAIGIYRGVPGVLDALPVLLLTQLACIVAFTAIALALGVVTTRFMALGVLYGFLIEAGVSQMPTNLKFLAVTPHALGMLSSGNPGTGGAIASGLAGCLVIAAVALGVAMLVFSRRQYDVGGSRES